MVEKHRTGLTYIKEVRHKNTPLDVVLGEDLVVGLEIKSMLRTKRKKSQGKRWRLSKLVGGQKKRIV